jgi:uncharacterized protein
VLTGTDEAGIRPADDAPGAAAAQGRVNGRKQEKQQMDVSLPPVEVATPRADEAMPKVTIPQYQLHGIFAVWAAAALPMAALAWVVAPALAERLSGEGDVPMVKALCLSLAGGLIWQFVLVVALVGHEQRDLRWSTVRDALWLRSPRSPHNALVGGRVWLILIPLIVIFAAEGVIPSLPYPDNRDLGGFLGSDVGQNFLSGNWGFFSLLVVLWLFNTVLGEELLFRGFLLPRMNGAFGRGDWVANGVLFATYHLHMPWRIPAALLDMFILAYPTKRYRSAWIGIAVHSAQSVFFAVLVLALVAGGVR